MIISKKQIMGLINVANGFLAALESNQNEQSVPAIQHIAALIREINEQQSTQLETVE